MGYGATSKGGGGSGSAGGGKKKGRGGKHQKSRTFKVKEKATAAVDASASSALAFTVQEPNPEQRARLLAARRRGEQLVTAANVRRRKSKPVDGTPTTGRVLGGNSNSSAEAEAGTCSAVVAGDGDEDENDVIATTRTNTIMVDRQQGRQQIQQFPIERKARQSFLATQEANMETVRRRREETKKAKRMAVEQQQQQQQPFAPQIALSKQQWDMLAARLLLDGNGNQEEKESQSLGQIRRLLELVLRNAATKSDPKYKRLKTSNHNLWMRLLRFQEVVSILEEGAGFERRVDIVVGTDKQQIETEALRSIEMERDRIHLKLSQALDEQASSSSSGSNNNNPDAIGSLVADLDALEITITAASQQQLAAVCVEAGGEARQHFELCHVGGAGEDGLGAKRILAILRALETWYE
jgi:hypothetical protein